MGKKLLTLTICFLMLCFASASFAWQGRMEGMDNPSGLISDESDLLIHPAKIVDGTGSNYYGFYKFNYTQVPRWDNGFTYTNSNTGAVTLHLPFTATGSERDQNTTLGGTWAFGPGRLGLFFQYSKKEGSYHGTDSVAPSPIELDTFDLDSDAESFNLKLLYGLPLGSWKLGTELAFAHNFVSNNTFQNLAFIDENYKNSIIGSRFPALDIFPYMTPIDSSWNELSLKLSAEKNLGPGVLTFTPRIATVFHGVSKIDNVDNIGTLVTDSLNMTGRTTGWSTGADLWYRFKLNDTTMLPFLIRTNYDLKKQEESGVDTAFGLFNPPVNIYSEQKSFIFEVGGGIDKDITKSIKAAAGIYYEYLQSKNQFAYQFPTFGQTTAHNEYPKEREHRITFKLASEQVISPVVTTRVGLNTFYGWVHDHYNFTETFVPVIFPDTTQDVSNSGHRWGVNGSVGATVKVAKLDVEPFVSAGLQKTSLDTNNGFRAATGSPVLNVDLDSKKSEWNVGGGIAVKF